MQLQHLRDSGQINDPRYKSIVAFLQTQQAAGGLHVIGNTGGGSVGVPAGPLPPPIQQRLQQDGNSRSSGDTSLGNNSDSSRGTHSHAQAAYLQQALLAAQQKAQANAYSQQVVSKPLQTGSTNRDFNTANSLTLQVGSCTQSLHLII